MLSSASPKTPMKSKFSKTLRASFFICGLMAGNADAITLTPYSDRTAWEAAVVSFSEENFNAFTTGVSYEAGAIDVGDFSVSVAGVTYGFAFHNIGPNLIGNNVNGTPQINAATGFSSLTTLAFNSPIFAFGADWDGVSDGSRTTSFTVGGVTLSIPNLEPGFFGFVADAPFSQVQLNLAAGSADGFAFDNVVYSAARQGVPEGGSSFLVLATGLCALFATSLKMKRRR